MEDKNKIGDFFKTHLSDYKEEVSLMDLEMMSSRMSKSNFMKFNARYFNIYYAVAIFSGFLVSLTLGGHYIYTYKLQSEALQKTQIELAQIKTLIHSQEENNTSIPPSDGISNLPNSPSIRSNKSSYKRENVLAQPSSPLNLSHKEPNRNDKGKNDTKENTNQSSGSKQPNYEIKEHHESGVPKTLNEHKHIDPIQQHTTPSQELDESPTKKKVVIYKRDTIFEYDTLKVKKKRK